MQDLVYQSASSILAVHASEALEKDMFLTMVLALNRQPDMSHRQLAAILVADCNVSRHEADRFIRKHREV